MSQVRPENKPQIEDDSIVCQCGHLIYDGEVIRSRCVKIHEATALCRCKRWVAVPVQLKPT